MTTAESSHLSFGQVALELPHHRATRAELMANLKEGPMGSMPPRSNYGWTQ